MIMRFITLVLVVFLINGCSSSKDPVTGEAKTYETDTTKRAK
jgi:PBP1b-binding outer membrane lipoprotein LpoB